MWDSSWNKAKHWVRKHLGSPLGTIGIDLTPYKRVAIGNEKRQVLPAKSPGIGGATSEYGIELSIIDCISLWTYNSRLSVILFGIHPAPLSRPQRKELLAKEVYPPSALLYMASTMAHAPRSLPEGMMHLRKTSCYTQPMHIDHYIVEHHLSQCQTSPLG